MLRPALKGGARTIEGFRAGADDYLTKPFNYQELLARIQVQLKLVEMGRRLAEQEKSGMLNLVAAGLAHEVRNPVNAILNALRPLDELLSPSAPEGNKASAQELFGAIRASAERIDLLISDFLGVSRPHVDEVADWQIADSLDSAVRLLRYKYGREIAVSGKMGHTASVVGRTSQLNQVLMNLLDNAVRAAGPDGAVSVTTEQRNGTFQLKVRDTGPGIASGAEHKIFDPLFTTHKAQGSTGLGLYIVHRIVEEHRGRIAVHSPPGGGAEFTVELPVNTRVEGAEHDPAGLPDSLCG